MAQSINIEIAGQRYPLKVETPEVEEVTRIAAEEVNKKLEHFNSKFPDKSIKDKLAFVALNEVVVRLSVEKNLAEVIEQIERIKKDTDNYLKHIDESSR